jgi:hypothetical protein
MDPPPPRTSRPILEDFISEADLAVEINVTRRTLQGWRKSGKAPPSLWLKLGSDVLWIPDLFRRWLIEGGTKKREPERPRPRRR